MRQYLDLVEKILREGEDSSDRTGTGTRRIFGEKLEFDLRDGFPLLTTKKTNIKGIVKELEWFMRGETSLNYLISGENTVNIWNKDAYRYYLSQGDSKYTYEEFVQKVKDNELYFDLGDIYGKQWRNYGPEEVDQLLELIVGLHFDPSGRRHILNAWNPSDIKKGEMALPPCHVMTQWFVDDGNVLHCQLYVRSNDVFLGMPFNIASYAYMMEFIAGVLGLTAGKLHYVIGDAHLYLNHLEQAEEIITREPTSLPKIKIISNFDSLTLPDKSFEGQFRHVIESNLNKLKLDFVLLDYYPQPHIKAPLSVGGESECKK